MDIAFVIVLASVGSSLFAWAVNSYARHQMFKVERATTHTMRGMTRVVNEMQAENKVLRCENEELRRSIEVMKRMQQPQPMVSHHGVQLFYPTPGTMPTIGAAYPTVHDTDRRSPQAIEPPVVIEAPQPLPLHDLDAFVLHWNEQVQKTQGIPPAILGDGPAVIRSW